MDKSELIIPRRISREYVQRNPHIIFVYSNDYLRRGCEGMAWFFAGEENAYVVSTMYKYCANPKYFNDNLSEWQPIIQKELDSIPRDGRPIIPIHKIGFGCSRMREFCPNLFNWLWSELSKITTPHQIDWYGN